MTKRHQQTCPIAEFLNIFGDAWTLMIVREAFYGTTRFSEMQRNMGVAKNLLSERLSMLVDNGILEREDIGAKGQRFAYKLTPKGQSLVPVFVAMVQWSNEHIFPQGQEPVRLTEKETGEQLMKIAPLSRAGSALHWADILAQAGPGADEAARLRIASSEHGTA